MIDRYTREPMGRIWEPAAQFAAWLRVELAAAEAMAELGKIPPAAMEELRRAEPPDPRRVAEIEERTAHDVIAFLEAMEEQLGPVARYLHMGLTSSDVLDTSLALRCVSAADLLLEGCDRLVSLLAEKALEYRDLPMIGRTHGIHAEPITLGMKFLRWHQEFVRGRERLEAAKRRIGFGKISGAVGVYGTVAPEVEERACRRLGLAVEPVSSQIVPRDRHAEFLTHLAIVATAVENVALEIRGLQRTEVREIEEPFGRGQKGSSVMPHKRNPIKCENLVGLSRLVRSYAGAAMENVAVWHERDISHSSVERVAVADACILLDFMMYRLHGVIAGLRVYPENMRRNLEWTRGLVFSSRVLEALLSGGVVRTEAYRLVQSAAMRCWETGEQFREVLAADEGVREALDEADLDRAFDLDEALAHVPEIFERVLGSGKPVVGAIEDELSTEGTEAAAPATSKEGSR